MQEGARVPVARTDFKSHAHANSGAYTRFPEYLAPIRGQSPSQTYLRAGMVMGAPVTPHHVLVAFQEKEAGEAVHYITLRETKQERSRLRLLVQDHIAKRDIPPSTGITVPVM